MQLPGTWLCPQGPTEAAWIPTRPEKLPEKVEAELRICCGSELTLLLPRVPTLEPFQLNWCKHVCVDTLVSV
ncbi:unnamed protein product [Eretmochelys imbricata]